MEDTMNARETLQIISQALVALAIYFILFGQPLA